jgi:hypothetical protein
MRLLFIIFIFLNVTAFSQVTFGPEQLIAIEDGVVKVYSADFDNDGDLDLLSTATIDGISWWSNDGSGNFTLGQYLQQTGVVPLCKSAAIFDYDNDGDQDVVALINTSAATSPTSIQYFTNDGNGVFSTGFIVGDTGPNGHEIKAADFDSDGDTDVVFAEGADDEVGWIENLGSGIWGSTVILTTQSNGAQTLAVADFNADGFQDVMIGGAYDDEWVWHQNNADQLLGPPIIIGIGDNIESVTYGDLDGDGLPDGVAVYAIDGDVVWAKNNGSGFDAPQFILDGTGFPDNFPLGVEVFDLDQDGDLDVVVATLLENTFSWFENQGAGVFGTQQIIATGATNPRQVAFGDFDLDGDIDIAGQHFATDKLVWYENTSPVVIPGCTVINSCNYSPNATIDDGSCDYSCLGCTDQLACNYSELATIDDGSCELISAFILTWNGSISFCNGDGLSDLFAPGISNEGNSGQNQALVLTEGGIIVYAGGNFSIDFENYPPSTYEVATISYNDGLTGLSVGEELVNLGGDCFDLSTTIEIANNMGGCTDPTACNFNSDAMCDNGSCIIVGSDEGCTDNLACNYNPDALIDNNTCYIAPTGYNCDGSCIDANMNSICDLLEFAGCTNPSAINYVPQSTEDDGSCLFPSSFCGTGTVWDPVSELCVAESGDNPCPGDFNIDGIINATDLLQFLGLFSTSCE